MTPKSQILSQTTFFTHVNFFSKLQIKSKFFFQYHLYRVWDSIVGTVTHYRLDNPGFKYWWGLDFPHPSRLSLGPTETPIQWVLEVKQPQHGINHPPPSITEVKEKVELYFYTPSGPSWPVRGWTLSLPSVWTKQKKYHELLNISQQTLDHRSQIEWDEILKVEHSLSKRTKNKLQTAILKCTANLN